MSKLTRDEEIFMTRAAAELRKLNPGLKLGDEITQEMVVAAFKAVLRRDQELVKALDTLPALQRVIGLQVYNACRIEGMKQDHKRQLNDERTAGSFRGAVLALEISNG